MSGRLRAAGARAWAPLRASQLRNAHRTRRGAAICPLLRLDPCVNPWSGSSVGRLAVKRCATQQLVAALRVGGRGLRHSRRAGLSRLFSTSRPTDRITRTEDGSGTWSALASGQPACGQASRLDSGLVADATRSPPEDACTTRSAAALAVAPRSNLRDPSARPPLLSTGAGPVAVLLSVARLGALGRERSPRGQEEPP